MKKTTVSYLALIAASQARIAGMKAENERRTDNDESIAYGDEAFFKEAELLEQISKEVRGES